MGCYVNFVWNIHQDGIDQEINLTKGSLEAELGHLRPGVVVGEPEDPVAGHEEAGGEGEHPGGEEVHQVQGPPGEVQGTKNDGLTWFGSTPLQGVVWYHRQAALSHLSQTQYHYIFHLFWFPWSRLPCRPPGRPQRRGTSW